jgi:uncharacterized membrane protein YgcG
MLLIVRSIYGEDAREHARRMRQTMTFSTESSCIFVIALDDRHAELAVNSKFSTGFTPDQTTKLLTDNFVPSMRGNRLCEGIINTIVAIQLTIRPDFLISCRRRTSGLFKKRVLVPFMLFVVIVIWQLFGWIQTHRCPKCEKLLSIHSEVLTYSTYSSTGLRETSYDCKHCEHHSSKKVIIPQKEEHESSYDNDNDYGSLSPSGVMIYRSSSSDGGGGF